MKLFKRFGAALLALTLTATLTGPALAAEPEHTSAPGIAVQMDGQQLSFTDAAPEIVNGRTFLPFRAVFEAMGAEVDYDNQTHTVSAKREGVELSMVPGQTALTIVENGQTRTQEMDVAPYIKSENNRTYVPVRFAAEAFGYSVGWDSDDKTVILVDVDALFGGATFQLMDNFAAYCDKQQSKVGNMALTGSLSLNLTDKTGQTLKAPLKIDGSLDGVAGDKGIQLTGKLSADGLADLVAGAGSSPLEQAMIQNLLEALKDLSAEVRMDLDSKVLYISLPNAVMGGSASTGNTWYSLDLGAYEEQLLSMIDMSQLTQLEDATVGEALTWVMKSMPLNDKDVSYQTLAYLAKTYTDMLSDQAFTKTGNTYTAKMVLEDMIDLEVVLTQKGQDITAMDLTMSAAMDEAGTKLSMSMLEHAAPDKVDLSMDMSVADVEAEMTLHLDLKCVPTDKAPQTQLPAGVQAIPLA